MRLIFMWVYLFFLKMFHKRQSRQWCKLIACDTELLKNGRVQKLVFFAELYRPHAVPQICHVSIVDNWKYKIPAEGVGWTQDDARPQAEEHTGRAEKQTEDDQTSQVIWTEIGERQK